MHFSTKHATTIAMREDGPKFSLPTGGDSAPKQVRAFDVAPADRGEPEKEGVHESELPPEDDKDSFFASFQHLGGGELWPFGSGGRLR